MRPQSRCSWKLELQVHISFNEQTEAHNIKISFSDEGMKDFSFDAGDSLTANLICTKNLLFIQI